MKIWLKFSENKGTNFPIRFHRPPEVWTLAILYTVKYQVEHSLAYLNQNLDEITVTVL